jgi:hypothetical protein
MFGGRSSSGSRCGNGNLSRGCSRNDAMDLLCTPSCLCSLEGCLCPHSANRAWISLTLSLPTWSRLPLASLVCPLELSTTALTVSRHLRIRVPAIPSLVDAPHLLLFSLFPVCCRLSLSISKRIYLLMSVTHLLLQPLIGNLRS